MPLLPSMHLLDAGCRNLRQLSDPLEHVKHRYVRLVVSRAYVQQVRFQACLHNNRNENHWDLIEQTPSLKRFNASLQRSNKHFITDFHTSLHIAADGLNLVSSKGERFFRNVIEKLRIAVSLGYVFQQYAERLPKTSVNPSQRLHLRHPFSIATPKKSNFHYARVYLQPTELVSETGWSINSTEESNSLDLDVRFRTSHITHTPTAFKAGTDTSPNTHMTQSSIDSFKQTPPSLNLHTQLRNLLNTYPNSIDTEVDLRSIASMALNLAEANSRNSFQVSNNGNILVESGLTRAFHDQATPNAMTPDTPLAHQVYIGLGSNVGDCVDNIESACRELNNQGIIVTRTSFLYKTKPMYLENQETFFNGVCEAYTSFSPSELLKKCQWIETNYLGRKKTVRNGPRSIDLDILLYDNSIFDSSTLTIPHVRIMEREFVLRPLCDLIPKSRLPSSDFSSLESPTTFEEQLSTLENSSFPISPMTPLLPHQSPLTSQFSTRPTNLMAIVNLTPDSFSDGGLHNVKDPVSVISSLRKDLKPMNGLSVIDIGGQSTRPRAPQVTAENELSRIIPTIKAIRSDQSFTDVAISVDTYRAAVASAAIEAGANIINDVSAGVLDPEMLPTIAKLRCTCILMHMRGNPDTMNTLTDYPDGIIQGVGSELLLRVLEAEKAGIRRWRICLDPGIGFAKTQAQNLELLRRFDELRDFEGLRGFPWVVGVSRKGFVGKITGVEEASERLFGTAAAVTAAVKGGADVVRVHDVGEMGQVVRMADAIWRV